MKDFLKLPFSCPSWYSVCSLSGGKYLREDERLGESMPSQAIEQCFSDDQSLYLERNQDKISVQERERQREGRDAKPLPLIPVSHQILGAKAKDQCFLPDSEKSPRQPCHHNLRGRHAIHSKQTED